MKKMLILTSMLCALLLVAVMAAAEVAGDFRFTRYQPYQDPKQQRLLMDDYRNWFIFDQIDYPVTQRVLDASSLDVDMGDLATPAIAGAQRILTPKYAWRYGYDLETGDPLLSPYGEQRVLKAAGYGATPLSMGSAVPVQMTMRENFRARRARTMARWLGRKYNRLNIIRRYTPYPLNSIESMDNLDRRPIFLDSYERYQGLRDFHSNILLRQRFLGALPGFSYTELYQQAGEGEYKTDSLGRMKFLGDGVGVVYSDLSKHFGEDLEENSNILLRNSFIRTQAPGMVYYDRYPETRTGAQTTKAVTSPAEQDTTEPVPIGTS